MINSILYIGDTEGLSGYAQSTRRMILALQDAGVNICAKYVPHDSNISPDTTTLNRVRSLYGNTGTIVIHQQIPHMMRPVDGAYNIGFTMFETTKIPDEWVPLLSRMDEVWVPSLFNKTTFEKSGLSNVFVAPFPIDTQLYIPGQKNNDKFVFLSMFQWTERKNWQDLLKAYFVEFSYQENVDLYLKVYGANASEYERTLIQNQINSVIKEVSKKNRPNYTLDVSVKTETEMIKLFQDSDILVMPSKGEAIGLTYLEAMACGKPCIATAWGGQAEFIDDTNGYLVDYTLESVDGMPHIKEYRRDQQWAKSDIASLMKKMRSAYNDHGAKSQRARETVVEKFSSAQISEKILNRLETTGRIVNDTRYIPSISYRGDAFGLSGYSTSIRLNLKILKQAMIDLKLLPISHDRRQLETGAEKDYLTKISKFTAPGKILIDHQTPEFFDTKNDQYKIGITYFETSKIPDSWVGYCNDMNELWLSSEGNKKIFQASGVKTHIEVMEPFLDSDYFEPKKKPWNIENKRSFSFLSVFEFIPRKGWDVLVEAFARTFRKDEDVCLIIKTHREYPPMTEEDIKTVLKNHFLSKGISEWPKILVYTKSIPYSAIPNLYAACDIFVLPSRGESICYPALEAMSCGKPCIMTDADFINKDNGYIIGSMPVPVFNFNHSPWYTPDQNMAEPDLESLKSIMRHVFENKQEVERKGRAARRTIELKHSLNQGAKRITQRLRLIAKNL